MHFSLIYVGEKPGAWVEQVCGQYSKRLPAQLGFNQTRLSPVKRNKNTVVQVARAEEWKRIKDKIPKDAVVVLLDERGKQLTSTAFAQKVDHWQQEGQDVVFVIAGADGVNEAERNSVDFLLALSHLTLPHELARVLFVEQLYRAWTISTNHPYHRV